MTDIITELTELRARIDALEKQVKAAPKVMMTPNNIIINRESVAPTAPPKLLPQWKHEDDFVKWQLTPGHESYLCEDGKMRCVVPAQPRPANYTDSDGREWEAGEWKVPSNEEYFTGVGGEPAVNRAGASVADEFFNGWRWSAKRVENPREFPDWIQRLAPAVIGESVSGASRLIDAFVTANIKAIAREEAIRELQRVVDASPYSWFEAQRRIAELRGAK